MAKQSGRGIFLSSGNLKGSIIGTEKSRHVDGSSVSG
jgi:hypothetical protein